MARLPRRRISVRRMAAVRMAELYRLAVHRRAYGIFLSPDQWSIAIAETLAAAPRGASPTGKAGREIRWAGLDLMSLRREMAKFDLGTFSDDELATIVRAVDSSREHDDFARTRSDTLAKHLSVTAEERWLCNIRTIGAIDETPAERRVRNRAEKNERDKKRQRTNRAGKHRPQSKSLSAEKPWEKAGISRATWYRQKRETTLSPDLLNIGEATKLSHTPERLANCRDAA